jgi:hypothetical protein
VSGTFCTIGQVLALLTLLLAGLPPAPARAEDDRARAAALAESAVVLGRSGDYAEALALFEKAYALDPAPILLYNIGRVAEKAGDLKRSASALRAFLELEADPSSRDKAQQALEEVLARLPAWLTVSCPTEGAVVELDGRPVGRVPLAAPLEVSPGRHALRVLAPQKHIFEKNIEIRGQESLAVSAVLEDLAPAPVPATVLARPQPSDPGPRRATNDLAPRPAVQRSIERSGWSPALTWTVVGAGAALLVGGGVAAYFLLRGQGPAPAEHTFLVR